MEPRLKTALWLAALVRICNGQAIPCAVVRRGDGDAGAVLIKRNRLDGTFEVLGREADVRGGMLWRPLTGPAPVAESVADAYIGRQTGRDPDLWVVEIEDRGGSFSLPAAG